MNDLEYNQNRPLATDDLYRLQKVANRSLTMNDLENNPNFETNNVANL
jgi:hypothetical protein